MANLVKFAAGTLQEFTGLAVKDPNTLYAITDAHQLYKGNDLLGVSMVASETFPATAAAVANTVYVNTTNGSVQFWNGSSFLTLIQPNAAVIEDDTTGTDLVSVAALRKYVVDQIAGMDVSAITDRIDKLETAVETTLPGQIADVASNAENYTDQKIADLTKTGGTIDQLQTKVSQLETGKADKAATLAGYGITDAYTKTETDTAISTAVANVGHLKREIVDILPNVEDADEHTIYMVKKISGSGDQQYDEYMLINNGFEKVGDSVVNLTGYATVEYVNTTVNDASERLTANISHSAESTLNEAKGYADGLADNYATAEQGAKADTALQKADITSGTTNGTISVKGSGVAVKGLGSAAFADTSAFEASGAANTVREELTTYINNALTWKAIY